MPADSDGTEQIWFEGLVHLEPFDVLDGRALVERHLQRKRRRTVASLGAGIAGFVALTLGVAAATGADEQPLRADVGDAGYAATSTTVHESTASSTTPRSRTEANTPGSPDGIFSAVPSGGQSVTGEGKVAPPTEDAAPRDEPARPGVALSPPASTSPTPTAPPLDEAPRPPNLPPADGTPRVTLILTDDSLQRSVIQVPYGNVDITLEDQRTERAAPAQLFIDGSNAALLSSGETRRISRGVGHVFLAVVSDTASFSTSFIAIAPPMTSPTEPLHTVTVDLASDTIELPHRVVGVGAPWRQGFGELNSDRWTGIVTGQLDFRIPNPERRTVDIRIDELPQTRRSTRDETIVFKVSLPFHDSRRWTLVLSIDGGPEQRLVLWQPLEG